MSEHKWVDLAAPGSGGLIICEHCKRLQNGWNREAVCPHAPADGAAIVAKPHILQFFAYGHLPERLRVVSAPFGSLASVLAKKLPDNAERDVALRKLLEAKDAAVRAVVAKA